MEAKPGRTSIAEFEKLLAASEQKLELLEGEVVAFAGGSVAHGMLCSRLHIAISAATKPPCHVFTSDVAVRLDGGRLWTETTYGIGETVELRTAGVAIDVGDLYADTRRVLST